jgi:hypothetical protein
METNKNRVEFTQETKEFLSRQHRNTRHDAVGKLQEIRDRWSGTHNIEASDRMLDEIAGAIMNLKQREPIPPESQESKEERAQIRRD